VAVPLATIAETFRAVAAEQAQAAVVPVENSTGGVIAETLDCLLDTDLRICAEAHLPVHISLVAPGRLEDIRTLYTHPQPYAQTRAWLREHLPAVEVEIVSSTVIAAQRAAADPAGAALATAEAGAAEGLRVLGENIEDVPSNRTRFFVIAAHDARPTGRDKTSLVFATAHRPGSLYQAIGTLAAHGLNLTLIQSRPLRGQPWQYVFFVDFEGHREEEAVQVALRELQEHCSLVKVLGSYPAETEGGNWRGIDD
jgi:chorismate mutase/prephenate dehydratase